MQFLVFLPAPVIAPFLFPSEIPFLEYWGSPLKIGAPQLAFLILPFSLSNEKLTIKPQSENRNNVT